MKIKYLHSMAGLDYVRAPGDIEDLPAPVAQRYIDAGIAEAVPEPAPEPKPAKRKL
jgi:hypothetical protein